MRLIDADALKEHIKLQTDFLRLINVPTMNEIAQTVEEGFLAEVDIAPTIDAEPVVRCKDCTKCEIDVIFHDYWCNGRKVWRDHYCAYGERRTDETDS